MCRVPYLVCELADCARGWVFEFVKVFSVRNRSDTWQILTCETYFMAVIMGGGPARRIMSKV